MEYQLRHYKIKPGAMAAFKDAWLRGVYPLRKERGFGFVGAWSNEGTNEFVWLLSYAGADGLEEADRRYYASSDRKALDPDPAQYIEPGGPKVTLTGVTAPLDDDGLAQGLLDQLADLHKRMRAVVEGLGEATLNAAPKEGENSIAVLVTHSLGSELDWLHRAAGLPFERDRKAEFRARASSEQLRSLIADAEAQLERLAAAALEAGSSTEREVTGTRGTGTVTVGYCIAHALSHTAEHVGHAELTRQLLRTK